MQPSLAPPPAVVVDVDALTDRLRRLRADRAANSDDDRAGSTPPAPATPRPVNRPSWNGRFPPPPPDPDPESWRAFRCGR